MSAPKKPKHRTGETGDHTSERGDSQLITRGEVEALLEPIGDKLDAVATEVAELRPMGRVFARIEKFWDRPQVKLARRIVTSRITVAVASAFAARGAPGALQALAAVLGG